MSKCSCGYATHSKDEFCNHLVNGWNDIRIDHIIR